MLTHYDTTASEIRRSIDSLPESTDEEIFRHIPDFPGYAAGDQGSVWSCWMRAGRGRSSRLIDKWRRLKPGKNLAGRLHVNLARDGKMTTKSVHVLVLTAHAGPPPEPGLEVCHYPDPNPANNRLSNLKWGTHVENMSHKDEHGTQFRGETHPNADLAREDVERIMDLRSEGLGAVSICSRMQWPRAKRGAVESVIMGRNWNHVTGLPKYIKGTRNNPKGGPKGEASVKSILTRNDVENIMRLRQDEGLGAVRITRRLGFPKAMYGAIHGVITGRTWTHVTGLPLYSAKASSGTSPTSFNAGTC